MIMNTTHKGWYSPIHKGFLALLIVGFIVTIIVCSINKWNWEPIRKLSKRSLNDEEQFAFPQTRSRYHNPNGKKIKAYINSWKYVCVFYP